MLAAACAAMVLAASPGAAQVVSASPANAQALGDTLGFLRDSIAGQGTVVEAETINDSSTGKSWTEQWTMQYENLRPDLDACSLTFHAVFTRDGQGLYDGDLTYAFGQMTAVRLLTLDRHMTENNARSGHPTWSVVANPSALDVKVTFAAGNTGGFYIRDPNLAPRIAAAIARAAELCGASPTREGF